MSSKGESRTRRRSSRAHVRFAQFFPPSFPLTRNLTESFTFPHARLQEQPRLGTSPDPVGRAEQVRTRLRKSGIPLTHLLVLCAQWDGVAMSEAGFLLPTHQAEKNTVPSGRRKSLQRTEPQVQNRRRSTPKTRTTAPWLRTARLLARVRCITMFHHAVGAPPLTTGCAGRCRRR